MTDKQPRRPEDKLGTGIPMGPLELREFAWKLTFEVSHLKFENKQLLAEIERLQARNAGLQDALNKARGPEGELPDKVAEWLRTKGYEVRALESKP